MNLSRYGEDGIRILFGDAIDLDVHERVRHFFFFIKSLQRKEIIDIIPSFRSCLIYFDLQQTTFERLSSLIMEKMQTSSSLPVLPDPFIHEIPVRYGGECGPDMAFVSSHTGLSENEIIDIHTGITYTVFAIGFIPGFPYLGTLDQRIQVPRLETPASGFPRGLSALRNARQGYILFSLRPAGVLSA